MKKNRSIKNDITGVYDTKTFNDILADGLHPGGIPITKRVAMLASADQNSRVLDVACGKGIGSLHLAETYGCTVVGIDMSSNKIAAANERANLKGLNANVSFAVSDAEILPFSKNAFDVVISECSFSILPHKEQAVQGIWNVLKPGGRVIMTDVVRKNSESGSSNKNLKNSCDFPLIPCINGAISLNECIEMFREAGFINFETEDHSVEMKKLGFRIALSFGGWEGFIKQLSSDLTCTTNSQKQIKAIGCSFENYKDVLRRVKLSYALVKMSKP